MNKFFRFIIIIIFGGWMMLLKAKKSMKTYQQF